MLCAILFLRNKAEINFIGQPKQVLKSTSKQIYDQIWIYPSAKQVPWFRFLPIFKYLRLHVRVRLPLGKWKRSLFCNCCSCFFRSNLGFLFRHKKTVELLGAYLGYFEYHLSVLRVPNPTPTFTYFSTKHKIWGRHMFSQLVLCSAISLV